MIGTALIEECIKNEVEVYAVVRVSSPKKNRLREHRLIHQVDASLEELEDLPDKISKPCDTFYHIAWGNTGENRNSSTELQSRNIAYTLAAVRSAKALGCRRFIGAGSQAEYGPMDEERISPNSPVRPTTPYGASETFRRAFVRNALQRAWYGMDLAQDFQRIWDLRKRNYNDRLRLKKNACRRKNRIYSCNAEMGLSFQQRRWKSLLSYRRKGKRRGGLLCGQRSCSSLKGIYL